MNFLRYPVDMWYELPASQLLYCLFIIRCYWKDDVWNNA